MGRMEWSTYGSFLLIAALVLVKSAKSTNECESLRIKEMHETVTRRETMDV